MPHNLTHITATIRASGRTTTHGAILLSEVDRLTAENAELKADLDAATAWLRDIYRTAPAQETAADWLDERRRAPAPVRGEG